MFTDPGGVHAQSVGLDRFVDNVGDELVRRSEIVPIAVVAEGEVAEFHGAGLSGFILRSGPFIVIPTGTIMSGSGAAG